MIQIESHTEVVHRNLTVNNTLIAFSDGIFILLDPTLILYLFEDGTQNSKEQSVSFVLARVISCVYSVPTIALLFSNPKFSSQHSFFNGNLLFSDVSNNNSKSESILNIFEPF